MLYLHGLEDATQILLCIVLPAIPPLTVMRPTCPHEPATISDMAKCSQSNSGLQVSQSKHQAQGGDQ